MTSPTLPDTVNNTTLFFYKFQIQKASDPNIRSEAKFNEFIRLSYQTFILLEECQENTCRYG